MKIEKYVVEQPCSQFEMLFLKGDILYVTSDITDGGWHYVFSADREKLGSIRRDSYKEFLSYLKNNKI